MPLHTANTQQMCPYTIFHSVLFDSEHAGFGNISECSSFFPPQTTHLNLTSKLAESEIPVLEPQLLFGYVLNSTSLSFFLYKIRNTIMPVPQVYYCYLFFSPVILWFDILIGISVAIILLIFSISYPVRQKSKWSKKHNKWIRLCYLLT